MGIFTRLFCLGFVAAVAPHSRSANATPECFGLFRKALTVIRETERNPDESLNRGWTSTEIAELSDPTRSDLVLKAAKQRFINIGLRSFHRMELVKAVGKWRALVQHQQKEKNLTAREINAARAEVFKEIEEYLKLLEVDTIAPASNKVAPALFIATSGTHILNRMARALFHEFQINLSVRGFNFEIEEGEMSIPPEIFSSPLAIKIILNKGFELLRSRYQIPVLNLDATSDRLTPNWDRFLNTTFRASYRAKPPEKETKFATRFDTLSENGTVLQKLYTSSAFYKTLPPEQSIAADESLKFYSRVPVDYSQHIAVELDGKWREVWPKFHSHPTMDELISHTTFVFNDLTFRRKIQYSEALKIYISIGSAKTEAISPTDLWTFAVLQQAVETEMGRIRGGYVPDLEFRFLKVSAHHHRPVVFEYLPPRITPN